MDFIRGRPMLRSDLRSEGISGDEIDRARRTGLLTRLRPGAYLRSDDERLTDLEARHALEARAAVHQHGVADGAASHSSATALHGLPPARTVIDVARTLPFEQAVAVADAALHGEILTADELEAALRRAGGARGLPAARRVVAFADGAADGPGESISRVRLARAGLPRPELQHVVRDATGRFIAQVDFWWPDVVYREKRREDAVRATGAPVVRWDWRDLDEFSDVITRLAVLLVP